MPSQAQTKQQLCTLWVVPAQLCSLQCPLCPASALEKIKVWLKRHRLLPTTAPVPVSGAKHRCVVISKCTAPATRFGFAAFASDGAAAAFLVRDLVSLWFSSLARPNPRLPGFELFNLRERVCEGAE